MSITDLTWIDMVVVVLIAASTLLSLLRGLITEIASLAVWILAVVGASRLAYLVAELLPAWLSPPLQQTVGFVVVLILILILGKLISMLFKELISAAGVGTIDRILGMAFGLGRGLLLVTALAIAAAMTSLPTEPAWQKAKSRVFLEYGTRTAAPWLPALIAERMRLPPAKPSAAPSGAVNPTKR